MRPERQARGRRKGFTLIEMMVVIMIMAILGTIVLGVTGYASRKAASSRAHAELQQIKNGLEGYRMAKGRYPKADEWISARNSLTNYNAEVSAIVANQWMDPWGREYVFESLGNYQFRLWSYGPDTNNIETRIEHL